MSRSNDATERDTAGNDNRSSHLNYIAGTLVREPKRLPLIKKGGAGSSAAMTLEEASSNTSTQAHKRATARPRRDTFRMAHRHHQW